MRQNRIPRGLWDRGLHVARSSGPDAEACLLPQRWPRANRGWIKQNLRRHERESDNRLMLRYNNDLTV